MIGCDQPRNQASVGACFRNEYKGQKIMAFFKLAFASALAYGIYRYISAAKPQRRAAFANGESTPGPFEVRNAGPAAMASDPPFWDNVDQAGDENYPASDPPSAHRYT